MDVDVAADASLLLLLLLELLVAELSDFGVLSIVTEPELLISVLIEEYELLLICWLIGLISAGELELVVVFVD